MKRNLIAFCLLAGFSTLVVADEPRIAFPQDYKSYKNYLSLDRTGNNTNQIIRLFANEAAAAGTGKDGALPNGSILVGEIYKAKLSDKGEPVESSLGRRVRGKLAAIAVMEKRQGWGSKFSAEFRNGDWDFAVFSPDGKRLNKDLNSCRGCHAPLTQSDHLFSYDHLQQ